MNTQPGLLLHLAGRIGAAIFQRKKLFSVVKPRRKVVAPPPKPEPPSKKGFVILTKAASGLYVAYLDRRLQGVGWWTEDLRQAYTFSTIRAAENKACTLKHNDPRVLDFEAARTLMPYTGTGEALPLGPIADPLAALVSKKPV